MPAATDYQFVSVRQWRLAVLSHIWNSDFQREVMDVVDRQPWAKHPQTISLRLPAGAVEREFYLKVFHPAKGRAALKDVLKDSKAFRAWRQGVALTEAGFDVPLTIGAGEQRRFRVLRRAFILTRKVDGQSLQAFLRDSHDREEHKLFMRTKRSGLKRLASLVRRLHRRGFIHGDMVASNIWVSHAADGQQMFCLMDNDRTRRYPWWVPPSLWKRNLIQLNRLPLPGITLQDRMRFFLAYLNAQRLTGAERRLARWLERKTRRRREQCDGIDASGDFRKLMRWSPDFPKPRNADRVG